MQNVSGQISITFDAWTSWAFDPYLAMTAHYIHVPSDSKSSWKLQDKLIGFSPIVGSYSGQNIAAFVMECLKTYGIVSKVSPSLKLLRCGCQSHGHCS